MATIICPDCGKEQENLNKFCRNCGADLSKVEQISDIQADSNDSIIDGEFSQKSIDVPIQKENGNNSNELVILESEEIKEDNEISNDVAESSTEASGPIKFCPNCGEKISKTVKFCPNCGFDLNNISNNANNKRAVQDLPTRKEPIVSVILSFVFPGLGQFYNGQSNKGIYFIIFAIVSIVLSIIIIGGLLYLLVWLWSIIDAYNSAEKFNKGEFVEDKLF